ncbi:Asparaginase/glutaminase [Papiliotrema laurentii]|uniref:asparaginase n=1 Tax=Papiliotrema laurentii TaxID=5418 RepID=A0AAD9FMW2_PAPLA|nr:Asparaginase/glutaminase [Papiliotrema laurentii]
MKWSAIASVLVPTLAAASPLVTKRDDFELEWIGNDTSLPKIVLYDTGGTIRSASNYSRLDNINYGSAPGPTAMDLIGNYSEVLNIAQIAIVPFPTPGGSSNLNSTLYYNISQAANRHLCSPGSDIAGAIMFHGTNTEEDTIFGLDLTVNCSKPIVATGAMRPQSYISHDGPSNFYQALAVAADPKARDRGALIVFNDRIVSAFYGVKTNGNTPDTFKALEQGTLGAVLGGQPYWFFAPAYPTARYHYDLSNVSSGADLPAVAVLFGSQGFDSELIYAAVANGAKGVVIMGAGAGQLSSSAVDAARDLKAQGIPVVASLRPFSGASVPRPYPADFISSGYMLAGKARIQLQLCLATGMGWEGCRTVFEQDIREAVYTERTSYYYS